MNRAAFLTVVGLLAGGIGFVAGVLVWLTITGLDHPGVVPVAQVTGAGLAAGLAIGLTARIDTATGMSLAVGTTIAGLILGFAVQQWGDLEWAVAAAAALVLGAVAVARSMARSA